MNVLIVDAMELRRRNTALRVWNLGFPVQEADGFQSALKILKRIPIQLIISERKFVDGKAEHLIRRLFRNSLFIPFWLYTQEQQKIGVNFKTLKKFPFYWVPRLSLHDDFLLDSLRQSCFFRKIA